jgi:hydrogenase maturation protein HypF
VADARGYRRAATFAPVPLPGGDAAVLRPARQLLARFLDAGLELDGRWLARLGVEEREAAVWRLQAQKGLNAPPTHAAGRLFDAFATALGLAPDEVSYEAQAAIRLEGAARRAAREGPAVPFASRRDGELLVLDWRPAFDLVHSRGVDARRRGDVEALALAFHGALARACVAMAEAACAASGLQTVGLTGGCFMNRVLTRLAHDALVERGFRVLIPRLLPPNDGGVAAGQVLVAGGSS